MKLEEKYETMKEDYYIDFQLKLLKKTCFLLLNWNKEE